MAFPSGSAHACHAQWSQQILLATCSAIEMGIADCQCIDISWQSFGSGLTQSEPTAKTMLHPTALCHAAKRMCGAVRPSYVVAGHHGHLLDAGTLVDQHGINKYNLKERSPAYLENLALDASRQCIDRWYRTRRGLDGASTWWQPYCRVQRAILCNAQKGGLLTG
eukprot:455417-Amphidinium_carterae.2